MSDNRPVEHIPLDELYFDLSNPRFPDRMIEAEEDEVIEWMIRNGDIEALMESIATTGYSDAEPVLTVKREEKKYDVVEGNRRLAAVKLLNHPEKAMVKSKTINSIAADARHTLDLIPALVYEKKPDIIAYLGYRHITGVKSWGPLEKAKYLRQLYEQYQQDLQDREAIFRHISKIVATKPYHARKTLTTLGLYEHAKEKAFWQIESLDEGKIDFSVLGTAASYGGIAEFLGLSSPQDIDLQGLIDRHLMELFSWLFIKTIEGGARVSESRKLKTLNYVVSNPEALKAFRDGRTLDDAARYTAEADENFKDFINNAFTWIKAAESQINNLKDLSSTDRDLLRDIERIAHRMYLDLDERLVKSAAQAPRDHS